MRKCLECDKPISGHGNRKRCPDCAYSTMKLSSSAWQRNNETTLRYQRLKTRHKGFEGELISMETMCELLMKSCVYCGEAANSIDRINSSQGYIATNVQPTCIRCNLMKWKDTENEFLSHVRRICEYRNRLGA